MIIKRGLALEAEVEGKPDAVLQWCGCEVTLLEVFREIHRR